MRVLTSNLTTEWEKTVTGTDDGRQALERFLFDAMVAQGLIGAGSLT